MAKKKSVSKTGPSLTDTYNKVAALADTEGLELNVAQTKRVLACLFDVLEKYPTADAFDFVSKGLKRAAKR